MRRANFESKETVMKTFEQLIQYMCGTFLRLFHCENKKTVDELSKFVKFALIGFTNTALSYALNVAVLLLLKPWQVSWDYIAGNIISFALSVLWSWYWNSRVVFRPNSADERLPLRTLLKSYAAYAVTGIFLNNVLSWVWIMKLSISKYAAPLINLCISVPLNFILHRFWIYED